MADPGIQKVEGRSLTSEVLAPSGGGGEGSVPSPSRHFLLSRRCNYRPILGGKCINGCIYIALRRLESGKNFLPHRT